MVYGAQWVQENDPICRPAEGGHPAHAKAYLRRMACAGGHIDAEDPKANGSRVGEHDGEVLRASESGFFYVGIECPERIVTKNVTK